MRVQNKIFETEKEKIDFINYCENCFNEQINETVNLLLSKKNIKFYTLAGPSCSGKTTTAGMLKDRLKKFGIRLYRVSLDDFYRDRDLLMKKVLPGQAPDYDSIEATDTELLNKTLNSLFEGKVTSLPSYDFKEGKITHYNEINPNDYDVILFEGIQAVYPEITGIFKKYKYLSIYINVPEDICINGNLFKGKDVRLMRRIVRDYYHRNAGPEFSFLLWESVIKNEKKNIIPYAKESNLHLSSLLDYEINVIKRPLLNILSEMEPNSPHINEAKKLINKLESVQEISAEYVPETSVFSEFIKR